MKHISKLDRFHYHEALDRLSMVNSIVDEHIMQHPVVESFSKLKAEVEIASTALFTAYQMVGHLTHLIDTIDPILKEIADDYQFIEGHPNYMGFLNTDPANEWSEDAKHALEFLLKEERELFYALLDQHNLDVESEPNMNEIIFLKIR
jgi:hypothetical protein